VLEPRLSKRAESPRKHREIMANYLRKDQRAVRRESLQKSTHILVDGEKNLKEHYSS